MTALQSDLPLVTFRVVDCLGRSLPVGKVYLDGSYNCPFCSYPVQAGSPEHDACKCHNPACFALPTFSPERARDLLKAQELAAEQKRSEELEREALKNWQAWYTAERSAERKIREMSVRKMAAEKNACEACALAAMYKGKVEYIRHRKTCPKKGV